MSHIPDNINTVIFDLGGVLFDIDFDKTAKAFKKLGINKPFEELYSHQKQSGLFDEFEKGLIGPEQFRARIREFLPPTTSDKQIDSAWNTILIGFPERNAELLKKLGSKYRLFLLSNTNEIHLPEVLRMTSHLNNKKGFGSLFEKLYFSCRMGMRKPDREIFDRVRIENGLEASSALFIDDSAQNIVGAKAAGLAGLHCTPGLNLEAYFGIAN